jgi:hypothetical protein
MSERRFRHGVAGTSLGFTPALLLLGGGLDFSVFRGLPLSLSERAGVYGR